MKKVNYFLVFFLLSTILIPSIISESVEVESSEVSPENSGYKSIQIRFLTLMGENQLICICAEKLSSY